MSGRFLAKVLRIAFSYFYVMRTSVYELSEAKRYFEEINVSEVHIKLGPLW